MSVTETKLRCALHDQPYLKSGKCPRCEALQNAIEIAKAPESSVELDAEILKDIETDIELARYLHSVARAVIADTGREDWHGWNAASKLISEGTKLKRFARQDKMAVAARAHSRYLVEHEKDVRGLRRKGN